MTDPVLKVHDLHKTFRIGFFRKRVDAVRGIDFEVREGEIFGLLGPNGAGKTTTIKMILRLIFPNRGTIEIFGQPSSDRRSMGRLGYMPENPYVYQYLRPLEFLDLCGRLVGMDRETRAQRGEAMIDRVGLRHAVDRPIGRFSKGMMQRIGLAQALLHDPELLILDEPLSGLDPIGRKEIRDILLEQRRRGKTLIFTSHILSDVEMLCDRVLILHKGKETASGLLSELLQGDARVVDVELAEVDEALRGSLTARYESAHAFEDRLVVSIEGEEAVPDLIREALAADARIVSVTPRRETLEDLFVRGAVAARRSATRESE